jgi:hypothetical protein
VPLFSRDRLPTAKWASDPSGPASSFPIRVLEAAEPEVILRTFSEVLEVWRTS